jgi:hypothetical protein
MFGFVRRVKLNSVALTEFLAEVDDLAIFGDINKMFLVRHQLFLSRDKIAMVASDPGDHLFWNGEFPTTEVVGFKRTGCSLDRRRQADHREEASHVVAVSVRRQDWSIPAFQVRADKSRELLQEILAGLHST